MIKMEEKLGFQEILNLEAQKEGVYQIFFYLDLNNLELKIKRGRGKTQIIQ